MDSDAVDVPPPSPPLPPMGDDDQHTDMDGGGPWAGGDRGHGGFGRGGSVGAATSMAGTLTAMPPPGRQAWIQTDSEPVAGHVSSSCVAIVAGPALVVGPCQKEGASGFQPLVVSTCSPEWRPVKRRGWKVRSLLPPLVRLWDCMRLPDQDHRRRSLLLPRLPYNFPGGARRSELWTPTT